MVKDECDIIELFVKINSRSVNHIFVLDHDSKDGTLQILLRLKAQGYPLSLFRHDSSDFHQAVMLSHLARQVSATNEYDFIIPLDADEFIYTPSGNFGQIIAEQVPKDGSGLIPWVTYVPTGGVYYASNAPLYEVFRKRSKEPEQFYKAIIPNELAKNCMIAEGNHFVSVNGQWVPGTIVSALLQHVPVRSVDQITAKSLIGSRRLSIKVGRGINETVHWDHMAEKIRRSNYQLAQSDMMSMAISYAGDMSQDVGMSAVDESAPRIGNADDTITYSDLSRINLLQKFDLFAASLCHTIRESRGMKDGPN
jgi:glycosyltransferase involved in cell wall biosynthesis